MRPRWTALRILGGTVALALVAGLWLFLGPRQLGGPATYALIEGNSMEPDLHAGDLAVVQSRGSYEVGEVVAYHSAELDRLVLHRIVERDGDTFVLQGDNNDFLDSAQPTAEQIAGELAFSVPRAGAAVDQLRSPLGIVALLGLTGVVLGSGVFGRRRRGRARRSEAASTVHPTAPPPSGTAVSDGSSGRSIPPELQTVLGIAGGATVVLILVVAVAFSRGTTETVTVPDLYEQQGTFSYSAEVAESPAYDSTTASDGEAIYTALASDVEVRFDYSLTSDEPSAIGGSALLLARLTDGQGLDRTLELAPLHRFAGDSVALAGTLALDDLQQLVVDIQESTGVTGNAYFVTIAPQVEVSGVIAETPIEDAFAPELVFSLDPTRLSLAQTSALDEGANALVRTQEGSGPRTVPATFNVLGASPTVEDVRRHGVIALVTAAAIFVVILGLGLVFGRRTNTREAAIAARRGRWLIDTKELRSDRRRVELAHLDDLMRIAEQREQPVLQVQEQGQTTYAFDDGSVQYQYVMYEIERDEQTVAFDEDELGSWLPLERKLAGGQTDPVHDGADDPAERSSRKRWRLGRG